MATVKTTCRFCLVRCGMIAETEGNVVAEKGIPNAIPNAEPGVSKVLGDRDHPLSKGYLCVKGKASLDITYSPDRVIYPQRRVGERGSGKWERVSWDEALDDIAARLTRIIEEDGARAVAVQALPPKEYFAFDIFCDIIGTPTFFKHDSHQCFTPQLMADVLTYGGLVTYPGFIHVDEAEVVVMWGVNLSETNGSKATKVRSAQRHKGAKTIVVDPRPTRSAKEADLWLRIRPGTDAALALGFLNVMISEGLYDAEFVDAWTIGFDELKARVADYTPEKVARITWIPAEQIVAAARMFGEARTAGFYTFIGATMGGNAVAALRLMGFIPALKGNLDKPGFNRMIAQPKMRLPGYYGRDTSADDVRGLAEQLSADKFPLFAGPNAITTPYPHPRQVVDAILTGEPYPVRALWTSCNPMVGLEDSYTTLEALKALDLLIVSDLFESPTAHLADYILPITTHLESNAITEYTGLNLITARVRAMPPRGEAREEAEPVLDVLQRMGYADKVPVQSYEELLDWRLAPLGMTFAELAEMGSYQNEDVHERYLKGKLRPDGEPGFNTPSGKIEFASEKLRAFGYDPLPDFVEPKFSPYSDPETAEDYPYVLVSGTRAVEYYSTLGIQIPYLRNRRPWPGLEMAPETAEALGLEQGDWVRIEAPTTDKTIKRAVAIIPGMDPRVMNAEGLWYTPGCDDLIEGTLEVGANVLTPLTDEVDPICGGSTARCLMCRVVKLTPEEWPAPARRAAATSDARMR